MYDDPSIPTTALGPSLSTEAYGPSKTSEFSSATNTIQYSIVSGTYNENEIMKLLNSLPQETLRKLIYRFAGMDASFLTMLTKQIRLVEAVLNQLVTPDGQLRPVPEGIDISLKDALTISSRNTQMLLKDLPKMYTVDRLQRLERAIGDVMDEHFTPEQQSKVLDRLQELTALEGSN